ncbi:Nn.00g047970.m01.CDS01 [Neocucurbitaria sp. VM-36]
MTISHIFGVLLAPTLAMAAAFPWALPQPTIFVPAVDVWSPAPTQAPQPRNFELFRRQDESEADNTCGFVSGLSESSITCNNPTQICATNTYLGVHGCCDSAASLASCTIPTTCIPQTAMSTACTDAACSNNAAIAKCTDGGLAECYEWLFVYPKTTMTQHGCAASQFTSTALRGWGVSSSSGEEGAAKTVTVTAPPATTPTTSTTPSSPSSGSKKPPSLGAIIGGTIGGCILLSTIAFAFFLCYRRRTARQFDESKPKLNGNNSSDYPHSVTEYNPAGFHGRFVESDHKLWQQQQYLGAVHRESNAVPEYPGMSQAGVVEVDGVQRPVEAPT